MMAQQRTSSTNDSNNFNLSDLQVYSQHSTKLSPYGNSQIKSWGRPVKSQYHHHTHTNSSGTGNGGVLGNNTASTATNPQLLNAEKSLIVADSSAAHAMKKEKSQMR